MPFGLMSGVGLGMGVLDFRGDRRRGRGSLLTDRWLGRMFDHISAPLYGERRANNFQSWLRSAARLEADLAFSTRGQ